MRLSKAQKVYEAMYKHSISSMEMGWLFIRLLLQRARLCAGHLAASPFCTVCLPFLVIWYLTLSNTKQPCLVSRSIHTHLGDALSNEPKVTRAERNPNS